MNKHDAKTSDNEIFLNILKSQDVRSYIYDKERRARYTSEYQSIEKRGFEDYAFARLFDEQSENRHFLGLERIYRCGSARVDGYLHLSDPGEVFPILLEIKTTLSWGSLGTALAQFISGRHLLMKENSTQKRLIQDSNRGLIVFNEFSQDWIRGDKRPMRPWAQLYRHLDELSGTFRISALQITTDGFSNPFLAQSGTVRLESLFRDQGRHATLACSFPPTAVPWQGTFE